MEKTYEGYSYELITKDGEDLWKITQGAKEYFFSVIDYGIDEAVEEIENEKEEELNDKFSELNSLIEEFSKTKEYKYNIKATIDTVHKTIKLQENTKISDFLDFIEQFKIDINGYSIVATEVCSYPYYPVTYPSPYVPQPITTPDYPWTSPTIIW